MEGPRVPMASDGVLARDDARRAGGRPGSIYRLGGEDLDVQRSYSLHDMGIAGLLRAIPADSRPCVVILGVEPETIAYTVRGFSILLDQQADQSKLVQTGLNTIVSEWSSADINIRADMAI